MRWVCPRRRSPAVAVWTVAAAAVLFTLYTPVYSTITAVCTIFLYLSYVVPIVLGARAHGRTWTTMGPWHLGRWFRPLAWLSVAGCVALIGIGMQPPNERSVWVVGGMAVLLALVWIGGERYRFPGPPHLLEIGMGVSRPQADEPVDDRGGGHVTDARRSGHDLERRLPLDSGAQSGSKRRPGSWSAEPGGSYPTATLLELRADHAAARDAVTAELDLAARPRSGVRGPLGAFRGGDGSPHQSRSSCSGPTWDDRSARPPRPRSGAAVRPGSTCRWLSATDCPRRPSRPRFPRSCPFCTRRRSPAAGAGVSRSSSAIAGSACSTTWASCSTRPS